MPMPVGDEIRLYRAIAGVSQRALAKQLGVTQQTIADWENGRSAKMLANMRRLFRLLFEFEQRQAAMGTPVRPDRLTRVL